MRTLVALCAPGVLFTVGVVTMFSAPFPVEVFVIAIFGGFATVCGIGDWRYHRSGAVRVGPAESKAHFWALAGGGGTVFGLMGLATVSAKPHVWLLPVMAALLWTASMIAYDEWVHHRRRRCGRYETLLHRGLVFGNLLAFLAWCHWCFVRPVAYG